MGFLSVFFYVFFLGLATLVIHTAYGLTRRYPRKFLTSYLYYLVFFYVAGFIYFVGASLNVLVFLGSPGSIQTAVLVLRLIATPASILYLYFLILWTTELNGRKLPAWVAWAYFSVQGVLFFRAIVGLKTIADTEIFGSSAATQQQSIEVLVFYAAILLLVFGGKPGMDPAQRSLARRMGILYFLGLTAMVLFGDTISLPFYSNFTLMILFVTLLNFSINIPPLFCLKRHLRDHPSGAGAGQAGRSELQGYCDAHGLTPRERDIIDLIMSGKDTKEIAKALFISTKTVKNNISKIFQKTHAKSRVQLLSFIEAYRERPKP